MSFSSTSVFLWALQSDPGAILPYPQDWQWKHCFPNSELEFCAKKEYINYTIRSGYRSGSQLSKKILNNRLCILYILFYVRVRLIYIILLSWLPDQYPLPIQYSQSIVSKTCAKSMLVLVYPSALCTCVCACVSCM